MNRSQRAREAWDHASDAHDVARLAARVRRVARDATIDDRRPPLASAAADWAAWLAAREAAAAAQRAEDAADAAAAAAEYAAEAAEYAAAQAELAAAWEPRPPVNLARCPAPGGLECRAVAQAVAPLRRENEVLRSNSDHLSSENASLARQVESMAMRIESLAEELAKPEDVRLREVLDALEGRAVIFNGLGARVGHLLDEMDEWIGRAGEAERAVEAAQRRLACVADDMTEHAYQELASALESPPRKETGCASAHESCGGLPAGTESDTEDTEPGGAP